MECRRYVHAGVFDVVARFIYKVEIPRCARNDKKQTAQIHKSTPNAYFNAIVRALATAYFCFSACASIAIVMPQRHTERRTGVHTNSPKLSAYLLFSVCKRCDERCCVKRNLSRRRRTDEVVAALRRGGATHLSENFVSKTAHERREHALLALALLMRRILTANDHHFAVTANDFALIAHGFYRRSYFHDLLLTGYCP